LETKDLLVGLDIGTTSVKAVLASSETGKLRVIGTCCEATKGMRHGKIVDIEQTANSIKKVLNGLSQKTNTTCDYLITAVPANMLQLESAHGLINVGEQGKEVDENDVRRVVSVAIKSSIKDTRQALTFLPSKFLIDGRTDVDDPRKMIAHSLEVHGVLVTAPISDLHNISRAIERAGYNNKFFVPTPLGIANVALDEGERTFGSIILDMGGGITTATVIHENKIKYATIDLEGGSDVTKDISVVLNTSLDEAEKIKRDFGYADPELTSKEDKFPVNVVGANAPKMIDEEYLSEIISARLHQILDRVGKGLKEHAAFNLPGGIVITGGNSEIQGTDDLVKNSYNIKVKMYQSGQPGLKNAIYAVALGVITYAYNLSDINYLANSVIYGSQHTDDVKDIISKSKSVFFKKQRSEDENNRELEYNDNIQQGSHEDDANNGKVKKERKSFIDFIKKFFD
jgi:cell division protein ftsA